MLGAMGNENMQTLQQKNLPCRVVEALGMMYIAPSPSSWTVYITTWGGRATPVLHHSHL